MNDVTMRVRLTFVEEILGTCAANKELHRDYIASKAPDADKMEDEIAAIGADAVMEKAMTVFPRNADGYKILWPYQVKGHFKSAQKTLNMVQKDRKKYPYMSGYKGKIDNLVFIKACPDEWSGKDHGIAIHIPEGVPAPDCERPLRAETAQGPRVALAHSETCPAGSWVEFDVLVRDPDLEAQVHEWLNSGIYYGIGQWRNAGRGRYVWELISTTGAIVEGGNKNG